MGYIVCITCNSRSPSEKLTPSRLVADCPLPPYVPERSPSHPPAVFLTVAVEEKERMRMHTYALPNNPQDKQPRYFSFFWASSEPLLRQCLFLRIQEETMTNIIKASCHIGSILLLLFSFKVRLKEKEAHPEMVNDLESSYTQINIRNIFLSMSNTFYLLFSKCTEQECV